MTIVAGAAFVFTRALDRRTNYDEGVYLASLDAMRSGQELGSELYTSQPPVFYWLLRALAAPVGSHIPDIRIAFALVATIGLGAAVLLAWRLYGPPAGVVCGSLLAIAVPYPTFASTVAADVPAVTLGLVSLALLTFAIPERGSRAWAVGAGGVLALAVLTKLLAAPFLVPFVALPLARRASTRVLPAAFIGGVATAAIVFAANAAAVADIWRQVVTDHTDARNLGTLSGNAEQIARLFEPRTPFTWLVVMGFFALLLSRRARTTWPMWTLVAASAAFLAFIRPLTDHHLVLLSVACAVSAGPSLALAFSQLPRLPRTVAVSTIVVFVAAGLYQEQRRLHRNDRPESPEVRWAILALEAATRPGALVITDQPIVVFRAGRPTVGSLVDISNTRVSGGTLTATEVNEEIEKARPEAVLVDRMLRSLPPVITELKRTYAQSTQCGSATLYLASRAALPPCRATTPG